MRYKLSVSLLCLLLYPAIAMSQRPNFSAREKEIPVIALNRFQNEVMVLLPCNWLPDEGMQVFGLYGLDPNKKPIPGATAEKVTIGYVKVSVPESERTGLNAAILEYIVNGNKQCPDDLGFNNLQRRR